MTRPDGRAADELRPVAIETGVQEYAEGSALIACGDTRVLCAASIEEDVPRWLRGGDQGWVTAEYAMLPRATLTRSRRETARPKGRTQEIQRLIGRSLRAGLDLASIPELSITLDCDVIQADGGTRTASITGAWVALALALDAAVESGRLDARPELAPIAAVSVGIVDGAPVLDLPYTEDVAAEVDMNVVMGPDGSLVEVQGTAEGARFSRDELDALLDLADGGCRALMDAQAAALESARAGDGSGGALDPRT